MKSNNDKKWTVADVLTNFSKTQAQVQQEKQLKQQLKEALMQNQAQALGQFVPGMQQQMQPMQQDMSLEQSYQQAKQGGIHIDPSKKGTFKAQATRMGMGIQEAAAHILANRDEYTSGMVRKANFARNFAKEEGGQMMRYGAGGDMMACPEGLYWDGQKCVEIPKHISDRNMQTYFTNPPSYGVTDNSGNLLYDGSDVERAKGFYARGSEYGIIPPEGTPRPIYPNPVDMLRQLNEQNSDVLRNAALREKQLSEIEVNENWNRLSNEIEKENDGGEMLNEYGRGGYTVRRSNDRKGKTHVVTGPDGTKKYFGDPNMGERSKSKYGKDAFYARHADSLKKNPYFRAYARATWEDGGEMTQYAGGGSPIWPPGRGKNKTYLTYSPFYGNSLTGQSSNMGYADNPFSDEKSDFFKVNTIRMPQSYIGVSGGADPYGKFNHNQGIMQKLGYDAYVGLPYNYDPNNTDYYSNTPSVGGRIRYNNTIDNQWLGIPWNKVFVEASGDYSQSDGLNTNFSFGTRFDGKKGNSKGYFEPHIGVSGSWGPHGIKPGAYSANALAEYQAIMGSNDIPDLEGDSVNMSDPMIQMLLADIYNENIENPLAKGKKQQGAMADIDLGFKTGFEWSPKFLTKRLPGSKIFGDLRYTAQPIRGMFVNGMSEDSQSSVGNYNGVQTSLSDQSETNKLSFSHQFTGGLGLKVPIGTVKDKIENIDFTRTRIPKDPKDCRCPDGTIVDRLEDGSCPCDDHNEECPPCPDGSVPKRLRDGTCPCEKPIEVDEYARHPRWLRDGGMIKRADGSYSQRGLWDNIRANAGSGKEPTREMLKQERKIRKKAMGGIMGPDDCEKGFEWNDMYQMCVPVGSDMIDSKVGENYLKDWYSKRLNVIDNPGYADAVGAKNVKDHTNFLNQTVPLINEQLINKYPTTNYVDELEGIQAKGEYVYDKKNPQINIVKKYMTNPVDFAATQVHEGSTYANEANQKALNSYLTPIQNAIIAQNIKPWDEFFRDNDKVDKSNKAAVRELEEQYDYSTDPRQDNIHSNVHASRYLFNLLPDEIITEEKINSMIEEGMRKGYLDMSSPNYHDDFYRLTRLAKDKKSLVNLFNLLASNDNGLNENDLQMAKHGGNIGKLRRFL